MINFFKRSNGLDEQIAREFAGEMAKTGREYGEAAIAQRIPVEDNRSLAEKELEHTEMRLEKTRSFAEKLRSRIEADQKMLEQANLVIANLEANREALSQYVHKQAFDGVSDDKADKS